MRNSDPPSVAGNTLHGAKLRLFVFGAACALCAAAQPATAQSDLLETVARAYDADAAAHESAADARENEARAYEAAELASIAWEAVGTPGDEPPPRSEWITEAREDAAELREDAAKDRENAARTRENAEEFRAMVAQGFREAVAEMRAMVAEARWEWITEARENAARTRENAAWARRRARTAQLLAVQEEGNMLKAEANAELYAGGYAALWTRAARAKRTSAELWAAMAVVVAATARDWDAAADRWDAVAEALERYER